MISEENRTDPDFIKEKTVGFIIVPDNQFGAILINDHIRYVNDEGLFKMGGFVTAKKKSKTGLDYWVIRHFKNQKPEQKTYILYWNKVQTLWKELSGLEIDLLRRSIDLKQEYIRDLSEFLLIKFGVEFREFMNMRESQRREI
jgi:hypothetical protein